MAYQTYITEAIVCGTFNKNTADRSYLLFTREAGMLFADAKSVREERSKQRYALQDFSHIRVSLVKGKTGWKIGSVEVLRNYYTEATDKASRGSVVNIIRTLRRFFSGEEPAPTVFDLVQKHIEILTKPVSHRSLSEKVLQVKILSALGYVDGRKLPLELQEEVVDTVLSPDLEPKLDTLIAVAIATSHL